MIIIDFTVHTHFNYVVSWSELAVLSLGLYSLKWFPVIKFHSIVTWLWVLLWFWLILRCSIRILRSHLTSIVMLFKKRSEILWLKFNLYSHFRCFLCYNILVLLNCLDSGIPILLDCLDGCSWHLTRWYISHWDGNALNHVFQLASTGLLFCVLANMKLPGTWTLSKLRRLLNWIWCLFWWRSFVNC